MAPSLYFAFGETNLQLSSRLDFASYTYPLWISASCSRVGFIKLDAHGPFPRNPTGPSTGPVCLYFTLMKGFVLTRTFNSHQTHLLTVSHRFKIRRP